MAASIQLVNGEGTFDRNGFIQLLAEARVSECARDYVVVAIIGPIASGKSTLMNRLVHSLELMLCQTSLLGMRRPATTCSPILILLTVGRKTPYAIEIVQSDCIPRIFCHVLRSLAVNFRRWTQTTGCKLQRGFA